MIRGPERRAGTPSGAGESWSARGLEPLYEE